MCLPFLWPRRLATLALDGVRGVQNDTLLALAAGSPALRTLSLRRCPGVEGGGKGVLTLATRCRALEQAHPLAALWSHPKHPTAAHLSAARLGGSAADASVVSSTRLTRAAVARALRPLSRFGCRGAGV